MNLFPDICPFDNDAFGVDVHRLLITSEGFEARSLAWLRVLRKDTRYFDHALVCHYIPEKKARLKELLAEITPRARGEASIVEFARFDPILFEHALDNQLAPILSRYDEVVLDISVMSKLMIMVLIWYLRSFEGKVRIIYTEPKEYNPSQQAYEQQRGSYGKPLTLPSYGVRDVVRTPQLSSVVMQRNPTLVIAFTSFNEQLIRALLSTINPSRLLLINGRPPHLVWREKATQEIHQAVAREYQADNPCDPSVGLLTRTSSTLFYTETFDVLAKIYRDNCCLYRTVVAPTGSKMQALGCALFKICCPDIHIEYPTPESYFTFGYSSDEERFVHEVQFSNFGPTLKCVADAYALDG